MLNSFSDHDFYLVLFNFCCLFKNFYVEMAKCTFTVFFANLLANSTQIDCTEMCANTLQKIDYCKPLLWLEMQIMANVA